MTSLERAGGRKRPRNAAGRFRQKPAGEIKEPQRTTGPAYWTYLGIAYQDANRLVDAGLRTREDLAAWTREQLLSLSGLSEHSFRRCQEVLDQPLATSVAYWTARSVPWPTAWRLSRERIMNLDDLRRLSTDQLVKRGFRRLEARDLVSLAAGGSEQ